jgi:hypothetical protein
MDGNIHLAVGTRPNVLLDMVELAGRLDNPSINDLC